MIWRGLPGFFAWWLLALASVLGACRYPATEVLVVMGTDAPRERALTISATVGSTGSRNGMSRVWVRGGDVPGAIELPASFAITPREQGGRDAVELSIHASLAAGTNGDPPVTFDRVARFRLETQQTGVLRIFLSMACGNRASGCTSVTDPRECTVSVRCAEQGRTCGDHGDCVSPDVIPEPRPAGDDGGILAFDVNNDLASIDAETDVHDALVIDASDISCPADQALCAGSCVSLSDPAHCGSCGTVCPAPPNGMPTCSAAACDFVCNSGFHRCGTACVSNADVNSCGSACTPCPSVMNAMPTCVAAICDFSCNAGFHRCGTECRANTDVNACGSSCVPCPTLPNSTATCDGTACGSTCVGRFGNCDGNAANGCETNVGSSPSNCSSCGTVCPGGASATCSAGTCGTMSCSAGRGECDGNLGTVCETDLNTDISNCGACGRVCSFPNAGASCVSGTCVMGGCSAGFANCNGMASDGCEANTTNDVSHCGSCTTACTSPNGTAACVSGVCMTTSCNAGYHLCRGSCLSNTSTSGCGSSCSPCPVLPNSSATCDGISCGIACDPGYALMGMTCVRTCGNNVLDPGETCDDGNTTPGDGCFSDCHIEGDPSDTCPGTVLLTTGLFRGYTTSMTSNFMFACGASGPDVVYQFYPPTSGTVRFTLTPDVGFDAILSVGTTCSGMGTSCLTTGTMGSPAVTSFPVAMDVVYYIAIGSNSGIGNYVLHVEYL